MSGERQGYTTRRGTGNDRADTHQTTTTLYDAISLSLSLSHPHPPPSSARYPRITTATYRDAAGSGFRLYGGRRPMPSSD